MCDFIRTCAFNHRLFKVFVIRWDQNSLFFFITPKFGGSLVGLVLSRVFELRIEIEIILR